MKQKYDKHEWKMYAFDHNFMFFNDWYEPKHVSFPWDRRVCLHPKLFLSLVCSPVFLIVHRKAYGVWVVAVDAV